MPFLAQRQREKDAWDLGNLLLRYSELRYDRVWHDVVRVVLITMGAMYAMVPEVRICSAYRENN